MLTQNEEEDKQGIDKTGIRAMFINTAKKLGFDFSDNATIDGQSIFKSAAALKSDAFKMINQKE